MLKVSYTDSAHAHQKIQDRTRRERFTSATFPAHDDNLVFGLEVKQTSTGLLGNLENMRCQCCVHVWAVQHDSTLNSIGTARGQQVPLSSPYHAHSCLLCCCCFTLVEQGNARPSVLV